MIRDRGSRLNWSRRTQRDWDASLGRVRFEIRFRGWHRFTLMLTGERPPAWTFPTLAEAQGKARQIASSDPIRHRCGHSCWPVVVVDDPVRALSPQPPVPDDLDLYECDRCRWLSRPVAVAAVDYTREWWDADAEPSWRCETCGGWIWYVDETRG